MEQPVGIRLSREMLKKIEDLGREQMEDRSTIIRKLVLLGYLQFLREKSVKEYTEGKITMSEAAKQSVLTIWEMEKYLTERGYKSNYSIDDLEKELSLVKARKVKIK